MYLSCDDSLRNPRRINASNQPSSSYSRNLLPFEADHSKNLYCSTLLELYNRNVSTLGASFLAPFLPTWFLQFDSAPIESNFPNRSPTFLIRQLPSFDHRLLDSLHPPSNTFTNPRGSPCLTTLTCLFRSSRTLCPMLRLPLPKIHQARFRIPSILKRTTKTHRPFKLWRRLST